MPRKPLLADRIVDEAVALADEVGWPAVRLHRVAARLGVTLPEIRAHYADLDAVANQWLVRADDAMLRVADRADLAEAPAPERIEAALVAWFSALGGRRRMLRAILTGKFFVAGLNNSSMLGARKACWKPPRNPNWSVRSQMNSTL